MNTKFTTGIAKGENSFEVGKTAAKQALSKMNEKINLSIVFSSSKYNYKEVIKGVREVTNNAPLIGCSTSGEFTEERTEKNSVAVALISSDSCKFFLGINSGLTEDPLGCFQDLNKKIIMQEDIEKFPNKSALIICDGLTHKGEEIATSANMTFDTEIFGGMAGDDMKVRETCVFMNDDSKTDAVVACKILSKSRIVFEVKHGHTPISPLLKITKASENILYTINNEPAWEVWKRYCKDDVKKTNGLDLDKTDSLMDVGTTLAVYELGIQAGNKYIIRWPLPSFNIFEDNKINFDTTISEGTRIRIMKSTKENQIKSAKEAVEKAISQIGKENVAGIIIFDCALRSMILKQDFLKAVKEINDVANVPLIGFEGYGEISMKIGDVSGFHNTTTVAILIPK